jgi:hypothetical protein
MTNKLSPEQMLDEALEFLLKWNAGSFLWYKDDAVGNNFADNTINVSQDRLVRYLKDIKVEDKLHMPIIYHLIKDGYIEASWFSDHDKKIGYDPNQIKITFDGIIFRRAGGYVKAQQRILRQEAIRIAKENNALKREFLIIIGTLGATIGTIGLLIWEIFKFYHTK